METAVPLPYNFTNHEMTALAQRRVMAPPHDHNNIAYYSNQQIPYSTPLQSPSYAFGHILNNHHAPYQGYFHSNPQINSQAPPPHHHHHHHHHPPPPQRLGTEPTSQPPPPEARPAKSGLARLIRSPQARNDASPIPNHGSVAADRAPPKQEDTKPLIKPEVDFKTEVDTLMKAIQSTPQTRQQSAEHQLPPLQNIRNGNNNHSNGIAGPSWMHPTTYAASASMAPNAAMFTGHHNRPTTAGNNQKPRRKYECTLPECRKSFFQKTHLDIHMRAHTGDKPFTCKEPSCGQRFSQLGNLKTHERRHTGEKPFSCDICHKRFAQRGNVRAHKITHNPAKPFTCRLDDCGKQFTQLGNLKSHQNKFHAATIRTLTQRFAAVGDCERMQPQERELWEYFSDLYKHSNKGIKGRGKDRRVSSMAAGPKRSRMSDDGSSSGSTHSSSSSSEDDRKNGTRVLHRPAYMDAPSGDDVEYAYAQHNRPV
ncbi:hypothetical protein AJ80_06437 [Polytolypa hystricis UAMH7299]|uniref:C2H2-type domain-containing protein n=1 Tax=Polytolypa hystricis (strain UAMH7299) TaxID=1447883 RepID=A0A2B7XWP3_POLH7|nr:hypothetical protein AJ80_06437 [Polytolypa hystricis UAMH7299]